MAALLEIGILHRHAVSPLLVADVDRAFETASHVAAFGRPGGRHLIASWHICPDQRPLCS